ncbi:3'(2'),5'-bisphosphate nucleotidase CysQ [Ancylobacter sp. 6x-1]|uniref:3'(2'),5'-bisphosphate nucleotidase CysQ n=2 Tax=Ancylobacter crimeensis TaxID=2579147 RepID=A0ABT0D9H2_9HYPH|nr:3'(2'),5'-bisphosphate nucleotidase CysQ [Ancylobacter crimeensis]MCK0196549.1 3'(2'),5'-bisphosphate nucleotidase CysQ [Ancylobacter crimeensis]
MQPQNSAAPRSTSPRFPAEVVALAEAVLAAGAEIMRIRAEGIRAEAKADQSPVTAADLAAEALLRARLHDILPGVPVIAEEAVSQGRGESPAATFLLVDPLDGTREFVAERGEFTVNVGLVEDGVPTLGLIYAPAIGRLFVGSAGGRFGALGAFTAERTPGAAADAAGWTRIGCRPRPAEGLVAVASRSHLDPHTTALLGTLPVAERVSCGSALKFGLVAEGRADVYPRLSPVMEWDVAAGHALLRAAGGTVTRPDGSPLPYGRSQEGYRVPGFLATGPGMD